MYRMWTGILLSLLLFSFQATGLELDQPKLKVLVITGGHGYNRAEFSKVFDAAGDIKWREGIYGGEKLNATELFATGGWKDYDVFVFYDMVKNLPGKARKGIIEATKAGKGMVMLHHTLAANQGWPEYKNIVGGKYFTKKAEVNGKEHRPSTYKHGLDIAVEIKDPSHPVTYGMKPYRIHDETYNHYLVLDGVTPLLTTETPTSEEVIAWAHTYKRSRVVYIQHGHDAHAYKHPSFRSLVARSIRYAAGRPATEKLPWVELFDGRTLKGWEKRGGAVWSVSNGLLVGKQGKNFQGGDLLTEKSFKDFEAVVRFRMKWPGNSGVWFRYQTPGKAYQADILEYKNPPCWSGTIYCPGKMFLSLNEDPESVDKNGWNTFVIRAAGPHLKVFLNGQKVGEATDDSCRQGKLGIQVHPGKAASGMQIELSKIEVRRI